MAGSGATAAGMGHLVIMDDSPAQFALTKLSRELWDGLEKQLPPEAEFLRCGTLWVAADAEELAEAERKRAFYADCGVRAEIIGAEQLYQFEPFLQPGLVGALLVPDDAVVYQPVCARWFLDRAISRGAKVFENTPVAGLKADGVTLRDGRTIRARFVVNATGAESPALSPGIPVKPRQGHLVITDRHPGTVRHQIVELGYLKSAHSHAAHSVAFNVQPRPNGQLLLGSSRQYGRTDSSIDSPILAEMLARAAVYLKGFEQLRAIRAWTGFRPATPDKLPLIGQRDGIWLATGHEGLGITTSTGTAALLAALILGETPPIDPAPYLPSDERLAKLAAH